MILQTNKMVQVWKYSDYFYWTQSYSFSFAHLKKGLDLKLYVRSGVTVSSTEYSTKYLFTIALWECINRTSKQNYNSKTPDD